MTQAKKLTPVSALVQLEAAPESQRDALLVELMEQLDEQGQKVLADLVFAAFRVKAATAAERARAQERERMIDSIFAAYSAAISIESPEKRLDALKAWLVETSQAVPVPDKFRVDAGAGSYVFYADGAVGTGRVLPVPVVLSREQLASRLALKTRRSASRSPASAAGERVGVLTLLGMSEEQAAEKYLSADELAEWRRRREAVKAKAKHNSYSFNYCVSRIVREILSRPWVEMNSAEAAVAKALGKPEA